MFKTAFLQIGLLTLLISTSTHASPATDFSGDYLCGGTDPVRHTDYANIPLKIIKSNDTFQLRWDFGDQGGITLGTGEANIRVDSVLAVVFWDAVDTKSIGVITYQKQADGSLVGNWTIPNAKVVGTETCRPMLG